jgi:hypothetical protein
VVGYAPVVMPHGFDGEGRVRVQHIRRMRENG